MDCQNLHHKECRTPLWVTMGLCSLAGGMGWGIRGQYGHESGAMMAGLLVSSVVALLYCRGVSGAAAARAMAWCTIAIGIGGSMTYGQTIGLTQDVGLIGNWSSWWWGMLGLAIKGGIWIGFGGVFLGMGLGGKVYRPLEILLLMLALPVLYHVGVWLLNSPFDPKNGLIPRIYFSNPVNKPRFECWGGLLLALMGVLVYARQVRGDKMAFRMGLFGLLGGLGFPVGQCWQSWHAWNQESLRTGLWAQWDPLINWWNLMEITFGLVMGGVLGFGVWWNRNSICPSVQNETQKTGITWTIPLLMIHLTLLSLSEFGKVPIINEVYGLGLGMALIPMVACTKSSLWTALLLGPVIVLPIAGKTLRRMVYEEHATPVLGWMIYFVLPMLVAILFAVWLKQGMNKGRSGNWVGAITLVFGSWIFYGLNFAFFDFPWPWDPWTGRTPSALVYTFCLVVLMVGVFVFGRDCNTGREKGPTEPIKKFS